MTCSESKLKTTTLVDLLRKRAVYEINQTAYTFLVDGEMEAVSMTYGELDRLARAIAVELQSFCQPGERALLLYPPGLEYIAAFFGCLYAGVVAVPAYPPRPNRSLGRIQKIIEDARAKTALTTKYVLANLERQFPETPELKHLNWLATDDVREIWGRGWREPNLSSDTLAFIQYTSGSTAAPKGVMISHSNILHNSQLIYQCFGHSSNSRGVIWLPPYHDMGLIGGIIQPLYGGFPVILMSPLMFLQNPVRWLQAISRYRATTSGGPNFAYDLCLRKISQDQLKNLDLSSWEIAFNGAEPISYNTVENFASYFRSCGFRSFAFYPCYGMAEATLIVSGGQKKAPIVSKTIQKSALEQHQVVTGKASSEHTTLVGCGQTLPGQTIIIVDPEKKTQCLTNEVGEIWVSGSSVAQGYWQQQEETDNTFQAYLMDTKEGPFLRTGDLGFLENGELFVTGRLKDVIIINGRNYYPQDIEWTIEHSHPEQIRPSCSAGFSILVGDEEKLVVIAEVERRYQQGLKNNANGSNGSFFPPQELISSIRRTVAKHHDLQVYTALLLKPGAIPKTSSGKIKRHACRSLYLEGNLEVLDM